MSLVRARFFGGPLDGGAIDLPMLDEAGALPGVLQLRGSPCDYLDGDWRERPGPDSPGQYELATATAADLIVPLPAGLLRLPHLSAVYHWREDA